MFKSATRPASSLATARCAKARGIQNATFNTSAPLQRSKRVELDSTIITLNNGVKVPALSFQTNVVGDTAPRDWKPRFNNGWRHLDISASFNNKNYLPRQIWDLADITRDELFITTKLESYMHHDPYTSLLHHMRGLRTGYFDLWYLKHPVSWKSPTIRTPPFSKDGKQIDYLYAWKHMEKAYESGKVKALGITNFSKAELENLLRHAKHKPQVHQMELTPYLQQKDFVQFNHDHGITISSYLPFGPVDQGEKLTVVQDLLEEPTLTELGEKYDMSPAQLVAAWVISNGHIVSISNNGADLPTASWANLRCDFHLDPEDVEKINALNCSRRALYPKKLGYVPLADLEDADVDSVRPPLDETELELERLRKKWQEEQEEDPDEIKYGTISYTGKVMPWVRSIDEAKLSKNARRRARAVDQTLPSDPYCVFEAEAEEEEPEPEQSEAPSNERSWLRQHDADRPKNERSWLRQK
ncbi:hypothetical protein TWF696_000553 [Orbilia brochopaga]|uniref:NADP-dependent oxidoreductase domain-containing protein n=1 Tax=Orbilia brochopaga TaxID=3140254 RepID=A0AAV9VC05_9PEZI